MAERPMSRRDRDDLIRIAKARAKQAKAEADQREKVLIAETENMISTEFEARDEMWDEAVAIAEDAAAKANDLIVARCADLGIPAKDAPSLELGWRRRNLAYEDRELRAESRKRAKVRLAALTTTAKTMIDKNVLDIEEALIVGNLESDKARELVQAMPSVEALMPALALDDIGVVGWQSPAGAAAELMRPTTAADVKRKRVRQAIAANPDASNREIARLSGVDHKTVGQLRTEAIESTGEIPAVGGDIPNTHGEIPTDIEASDGEIPNDDGAA
jgi:hypothetical protein